MANSSLPGEVWNEVTTSLSAYVTPNVQTARDLAVKVISVIVGTVGVLDNLFVIIILILFTKIAHKVSLCM